MGKEGKRCSTSSDVEAAYHKGTKPLQKDNLEPKKKQKTHKKNEMKKLRKSFKEMTKTLKNLQDFFLSKADLPGISLKELLLSKPPPDTSSKEEEPLEKVEELTTYECCFETEDSEGDNDLTVFVCGLDTSLPRDDLKNSLRKHFESCGCEVTRVFVPIECLTGAPLGYAFINVDDAVKAIELGRGYMGGSRLFVMMAIHQPEYHSFPNFTGCRYCGTFLLKRRMKRFQARPW